MWTSSLAPCPMEQAATPGGLGLPCSPKQALALYQHLFRCPAGLGQLWAALQQVRVTGHRLRGDRLSVGSDSTLPPQVGDGQTCPSGLELPTVLLQMERSRRAQEQVGGRRPGRVAERRVRARSHPGTPPSCSSCGIWSC